MRNTDVRSDIWGYGRGNSTLEAANSMSGHRREPWKYLSRDMNWRGALVGLSILVLLIADLTILGRTAAGYIGAAVVVVVSGTILRITAHRRSSARQVAATRR